MIKYTRLIVVYFFFYIKVRLKSPSYKINKSVRFIRKL